MLLIKNLRATALALLCSSAYMVAAIMGNLPMTWLVFFSWFAILVLVTVLFIIGYIRERKGDNFKEDAIAILWSGAALWFWGFAPAYFYFNGNLSLIEAQWTAFEFVWEVPILGAMFIATCIHILRPISEFLSYNKIKDAKNLMAQTIQYPKTVGWLVFAFSTIGYVLGTLQSRLFGLQPLIEAVKGVWSGMVIPLFLAIFYYLVFDIILEDARKKISEQYPKEDTTQKKFYKRMLGVTILIMGGSIALMGPPTLNFAQLLVRDRSISWANNNVTYTKYALQNANSPEEIHRVLENLKLGNSTTINVLSGGEQFINANINEASLAIINKQSDGALDDFRNDVKFITFFYDERLDKKIITIINSRDFYPLFYPLAEFFIGAGLFVLLLTVGIITFMSFVIARSIRNLATAVRSAKAGAPYIAPGIHTADEVEDLSHAFTYYVTHAEELQTQLRGAIDALGNKVHDLEITKRTLKGTVDDLARTKDNLASAKTKDEALLESIGDGMLAVDEHGKVLLMNRRGGELLHMNEKTVEGASWQTIIHELEDDGKPKNEDATILTQTLQSQQLKTTVTRFGIRPNGSIPVAVTAAPVITNNTFGGVIMVFRDITKEQEVDKAKNEFVSLASHQLRTPLSTINWYAEMLGESTAGKLSKKQRGYVDAIATANQRMVELVNALLNVSRIELGTISAVNRNINVKNMIEEIVHDIAFEIKNKGLKVRSTCDVGLEYIKTDPQLLRAALQNIINNAIQYNNVGGGVNITTKQIEEKIIITVKDTGVGIPEGEQIKIFTKLFRASNVLKKVPGGTGLGLYITKSIIDRLGGKIWFESKEGVGSTFNVELPIT